MKEGSSSGYFGRVVEKITGIEGFKEGLRQEVPTYDRFPKAKKGVVAVVNGIAQFMSPTLYDKISSEGEKPSKSMIFLTMLRFYADIGVSVWAATSVILGHDPVVAIAAKAAWNTGEVVIDGMSRTTRSNTNSTS